MSSLVSYTGRRPEIPDIPDQPFGQQNNTHATQCRTFLDYVFRYETVKRARLERSWNRAINYDANRQWNRPMRGAGMGRLWFMWEPIVLRKGDAKFPMPTRNIFSPAMQDEVARIVGVGSKPFVRLDDREAADAALLAKRVLIDRNNKSGWKEQNRLGAYHAAMFGQWIQACGWELNQLKTVRGPVLTAAVCPDCGFAVADQSISPLQGMQLRASKPFPNAVHRFGTDQGQGYDMVMGCPDCGAQQMQPYAPPPHVFRGQQDVLGRDFGKNRPIGEDITRVISPWSAFPANQGRGYQTDDQMEEIGIRTPQTLDWIRERHEDIEGLEAEMNIEVFRHHPVGTDGFAFGYDERWDDYALYDEWYKKPSRKFPRGRAIIMAGRKLLYSGELFIPGTEIPMFDVRWAQWELREGQIWGKSLAEDLFSVQDNINSGISQAMDMAQKWTSPKMMLHKGMDIDFQGGAGSPYASDIWHIDMRQIPPDVREKFPFVFGNQGNPGTLWQMFDRDRDHVETASGARAAEIGNVQGVELNYSALLFAAQKSAERRKPRTDGIRELKRKVWTQRLRLIAGLYTEERLIHYDDEHNETRTRRIKGLELKNQTEVTLEDEPVVDSAIAERASIQQALTWGTLKTSANGGSYAADRRVNRAIGVPEELNEDRNVQQDDALDEWESYLTTGEEPAIDQQADDHLIHYAAHNLSLEGRDAKALKKALTTRGLTWGKVLLAVWEWERLLKDLQLSAEAVRSAPSPQVLQRTVPPEQVVDMQLKLQQARQRVFGFPPVLELQILDCFSRLLTANGIDPSIPPLRKLLRMKAHALAHWKLALAGPPATATPPSAPNADAPPSTAPGAPPAPATDTQLQAQAG